MTTTNLNNIKSFESKSPEMIELDVDEDVDQSKMNRKCMINDALMNSGQVINEFRVLDDDDEDVKEIKIGSMNCSLVSRATNYMNVYNDSINHQILNNNAVSDLLTDHYNTTNTIDHSKSDDSIVLLDPNDEIDEIKNESVAELKSELGDDSRIELKTESKNELKTESNNELKTELKNELKNATNDQSSITFENDNKNLKLTELNDNKSTEINYKVIIKDEQIPIKTSISSEELKVPPIKVKIINPQSQPMILPATIKQSTGTTKPTIQTITPLPSAKRANLLIESVSKPVIKDSKPSSIVSTEQQRKISITTKSMDQLVEESGSMNYCIRFGCENRSVKKDDFEEYCSSQCLVLHCRKCFLDWVDSRKNKKNEPKIEKD